MIRKGPEAEEEMEADLDGCGLHPEGRAGRMQSAAPECEPIRNIKPRSMIRRTVLYSGRVQGVGFRYTTCRIAAGFSVTGFVRNLADGCVEAVIEGEAEEIEAFFRAIGNEMSGNIRDVRFHDAPPTNEFADFDVRF